jgi:hypothetical protein
MDSHWPFLCNRGFPEGPLRAHLKKLLLLSLFLFSLGDYSLNRIASLKSADWNRQRQSETAKVGNAKRWHNCRYAV